ncbi:MAG: iron-sulfur cluster assembly scaffold protein [Nitrososphaerota archaeon]
MSDISIQKRIGYTDKVIDHFTNPRNAGRIENPDITAKVGSVACGDLIKLYLKIDPESNRIEDIKFESYGCAANIATSSILTELAKGKTVDEAKKITFKDIAEELGGLPKIKMHCAVLSSTGLSVALLKYEAKKGLVKIDEAFVRRVLRGVLDPIEGTDIVSAGILESVKIEDKTITLKLKAQEGSELAKSIEEDTKESFEGLGIDLKFVYSS